MPGHSMPGHLRLELMLIAVLLPIVAVFAFWYVPLSVDAPQGFGADSEVSPRFAPYLLATLMAAAMVGRLLQLLWHGIRGRLASLSDDMTYVGTPQETRRGTFLNALGVAYGFVLIPLLGFYVASFGLTMFLVHRLGERRLLLAGVIALACVLFTYLLFEQLLNVRLPRGELGAL